MKGLGKALFVVGTMSVAGATQARALDVSGALFNYCLNTGAFISCASASITVAGSTLTAAITNSSNAAPSDLSYARLTQFGFFYLDGAPTGGHVAFGSENLPTNWAQLNSNDHLAKSLNAKPWLGHTGSFIGGAKATFWNDHSLAPGVTGTFSFNLTGSTDWSKIHLGWLGRDLANNEMYAKCYEGTSNRTTASKGECIASAVNQPPTVVPEPASMILLATGLMGLTGAGLVRRRRRTAR